jgi:LPXTG-motif cell wall-anchored protein
VTGAGNPWLLATGIADVLFAALFAYILLHRSAHAQGS